MVYQCYFIRGALAFELWTGRPAPIEIMQKAIGLAKEGEKDVQISYIW